MLIKLVDCAVQVVVKTATKSVNADQEFANFRYDKKKQVTDDNNCFSVEEEAKFERDMKKLGWFLGPDSHLDSTLNCTLTTFARKIIQAKVNAKHYARSGQLYARLLAEEYAQSATEYENRLSYEYYDHYRKDSKGMLTRMVQDEVIEVISEQELKDRHSSCMNYIEEFMRVHNAKRTLTFQ